MGYDQAQKDLFMCKFAYYSVGNLSHCSNSLFSAFRILKLLQLKQINIYETRERKQIITGCGVTK